MTARTLALAGLMAAACLTPIDVTGKRCPCAPGFFCDSARDRCASEQCTSAVRAEDFRAAWATPNAIRWTWTPVGDRTQFVRYELRLADDKEELTSPLARVYDSARNPELASWVVQRSNNPNELLEGTTAAELPAQHAFFGQLLVFDSSLCVFRSSVVFKATAPEVPNALDLYRDADPPGYYQPTGFGDVPDESGSGRHLEWVVERDPECIASTEAECGNNLKLSDRRLDARALSPGQFATAFLELRIASESITPSTYSRIWLSIPTFADIYRFVPFTLAPSDGYHTLQLPLSALINDHDGGALTAGELRYPTGIAEFNFGGSFTRKSPDGGSARVRIDDVRIRY